MMKFPFELVEIIVGKGKKSSYHVYFQKPPSVGSLKRGIFLRKGLKIKSVVFGPTLSTNPAKNKPCKFYKYSNVRKIMKFESAILLRMKVT